MTMKTQMNGSQMFFLIFFVSIKQLIFQRNNFNILQQTLRNDIWSCQLRSIFLGIHFIKVHIKFF